MSWINRFGLTNEEAKVINQYSAPDQTGEALKPGLFEGVGSAMVQSLGMQFEASQSSLSEALASRVEDSDYDLQQEDPFAPELDYNKDSVVNRLRRDAKEARLKIKNDYTPNPETTGAASMVLYGLTGSLAKGIGYSIAAGGNPILGGVMFGADLGRYEKDKLQDKGVDSETATKAGLITGVTTAVGMALPASVGTSYLKSAAFGGLVNPATDITEQSAIKFVLDHADYSVISKEYDPFDPVNLTTSSLMGVGFGLLGARGARVRAARESADDSVTTSAAPDQPTSRMNKTVLESIQNRDRSGKESRLQMQQIAQVPDFNRLRNGSTLGEGTPVIAYLPEDSSAIMGKKVVVSDTNGGRTTMRYALVEASEVMTSNSADGSLNADFTNPEVAGARAIAGNGRIAGLQAAYQSVKATQYRAELTQASKEFGISRRAVKKMREPVLVRVMEDVDIKEGVGELSNRTGTLKLNPAEQAAQDARNVRLDEVEFTADNEITTKSMDEFVRRTPDKEGLIDANGNVIYDNVRRRMKPAILAAAFPDTRIINRFISDDPKDRQIMSLLQAVSPEVMRLKRIGGEFDFTGDLLEAVADYIQTKQEAKKINGKDVEGELTSSLFEGSAVQSWFKDILLSKNPERLKDVLTRLREVAEQESGGEGFFGSVSREDVFNQVKSEFGAFDRAVESITPSMVDAAMELRMADVIEGDQPSGMNGDINKSIADEKLAGEQLDNGEKVNVSGEGVDPVAFGRQLADFRDTVFKNLLGIGFKEKLAAYSADIHEAFFRTLSDRLGVNAEEVVKRYGLRVKKGDKPNFDEGYASMGPQEKLDLLNRSRKFDKQLEQWEQGKGPVVFDLGKPSWVLQIFGTAAGKNLTADRRQFVHVQFPKGVVIDVKGRKLAGKHGITSEELRGLLVAIQQPLAVFESANNINGRTLVLLTELERFSGEHPELGERNIVVPLRLTVKKAGKLELDLADQLDNSIRSAYEKDVLGPDWFGRLLGYESAKGADALTRYHWSNPYTEGSAPSDGAIIYRNDTSTQDLYQSAASSDRLVTVHNISEDNLNKALDLGGFAAPSLGITKQTTPYTDFGDISLIGTKDMVDPKTGTPVFSQDAYTQTFPEPVWDRSVNEAGAKRVNEQVEAAARESGFTDEPRRFIYNLQSAPNKDGVVKNLLISKIGAYMFLKEKGIEVDVPKESRDYGYALKDKANEFRDEFEAWADKFAGQAFDAPMIEVKGKLKPITLENVVEAMRSNLVRNKEGTMTFGAGKIRAAAAKQFGSIEEIQGSRNQITDSQTVNQQNTVTNEKLDSYRALAAKEYQGDSFDAFDEAMAALAKVAGLKSKPTEARVRAALKKKGFEPSDETVKLGVEILSDIKSSMTDYFEAKPQRAVGVDEFRGAVVPERTSEATVRRLEDAGLTVVKYGDEEGARTRAIQDLTIRLNEKSGDVLYQNRESPRGMYTPTERMITLFGTADESTFIHESGHYFLDIMTDIAGRSDAPEQVRADIQTLMDWFGVKDLDEWNSLSLEEKRQFHEQFARGFEQYLRDGEAPSSKLAEIFKQFKDWLISIYKSSKELDVELTDEVRGVYDRMLATDREIEAKREADTPSLFGDEMTQAAQELVNSPNLPDETKAVIRDGLDAMGIKTEPPKGQDPLYGVMSDEEFVQNRFNLDMEKYGDMTILDENNNEISMREYVAEQVAAAERMENDANGISRAALCMFGNNAFD
ncbi:hypothetical protein [uncultured Parasutterella sp.]|uniref:MuF-C-terminal domain-containing protein n=1 Tax=uncultured Parasutterella sp. TaxID=1263098 RepID=UPI0025B6CD72|nr:hypothetical protein [uncultured Parasutterella sp.]